MVNLCDQETMARPLKEINWEVVEKLIEAGCSAQEIAAKFNITHDTLYLRFKDEYGGSFQDFRAKKQEGGIADIRAMIHAKALNNKAPGNITMLIFLARCRLGMREPEAVRDVAANQSHIDQTHTIMRLSHRITELEEALNGNKS